MVADDLGVASSLVQDTVRGIKNNRRVLAYLLELGCPRKFLSLPPDLDSRGAGQMDNYTYTVKALSRLLGISPKAIYRRSQSENWKFSKRAGRGGGKIYSYCDLPEDVQAVITLHEAQRQPAKCTFDENRPIPDSAHQTGLARFKLHTDWVQYRTKQKSKSKADEAFFAAYNLGNSHPEIYKALGKPAARVCSAGIENCVITAEITAAFAITGDRRRLKMYRAISAPRRRKPSFPST